MELVAYEQENSNVVKVTVSTKSVARIMGRGGSSINQLRDDTNTQIDVDKDEGGETTTITIKGTKKGIQEAKQAIQETAKEVDAEETYRLTIPANVHGQLIGAGGQTIRDLITRAGGPEDSKASAQYVTFPRKGDAEKDIVVIRAPAAIAAKIKEELEAAAQQVTSRVVLGGAIPVAHHRQLIGRGGSRQKEIEGKHDVRIFFPGSRMYNSAGEISNAGELTAVAPETLVKVQGAEDKARAALSEMTSSIASASRSVPVPRTVHTKLATPAFFRQLRSDHGVSVDTPRNLPSASHKPRPARIDEDGDDLSFELEELKLDGESTVHWQLSGKDEASLDAAEKKIKASIESGPTFSHEGRLWVPQSAVPRIVGKQGSGLQNLQMETGATIEIPRDAGGLCIIRGTKDAVLDAREKLEEVASRRRD